MAHGFNVKPLMLIQTLDFVLSLHYTIHYIYAAGILERASIHSTAVYSVSILYIKLQCFKCSEFEQRNLIQLISLITIQPKTTN